MEDAAQPSEPASRSVPPSVASVASAFPHLEIREIIGYGGMGAVYKVRQPKLDRFAALKLLPPSLAGESTFAARFEREAQLLARLSHPNVVSVYDYGQAGGFFYLLMEFVDGVNLRQAMRASRFTPAQALGIVPKICDALQYAHDEGVLHRDIKPENILLDAKGRVKLADFGIAKLASDETLLELAMSREGGRHGPELTQTGTALGTPHYMAPEQRESPSDVDNCADIYSKEPRRSILEKLLKEKGSISLEEAMPSTCNSAWLSGCSVAGAAISRYRSLRAIPVMQIHAKFVEGFNHPPNRVKNHEHALSTRPFV